MSQGIENRVVIPEELHDLYVLIRQDLDQVEEILRRELQSESEYVDQMAKYGFRLGGKRLRPAFVLLSGHACGPITSDHLKLAAAVELIHTATLIHDDVLDEATMRRHLETVNARWDNEASVLLGDYLLARSICLASSVETVDACRAIAAASRAMCEGELRQVGSCGDHSLSEEVYLEIITEKTAALCACCCRIGAHYAGASLEHQDALAAFGLDLGIAFQIIDDLLDVRGDESKAGKSLGTDLAKQKATLPLIRLLDRASTTERAELLKILSATNLSHREALAPWWERSDAIEYAKQKAIRYADQATSHLAILPESPAREVLERIAQFVITRQQ